MDLQPLPSLMLPAGVTDAPVAVLLSGGLDSSILVAALLERGCSVVPLYVRSGLFWEVAEQQMVARLLVALAAPRLQPLVTLEQPIDDVVRDHWSMTGKGVPPAEVDDTEMRLPLRNGLLILKAGLWCHLNRVPQLALGPLKGNPFADASAEFFQRMEQMFRLSGVADLRILTPFAALEKQQVMQLGGHLPLQLTFSCVAPQAGRHCGECNKCAERQAAFQVAGRSDLTVYHAVPC
ncbi:MAG: 7-cyano-7-deazaguanine synthase [Planctomycetota bacterium]|nr:7-cyano-7-deazaguanine synthase [Planctomycetota bacterium]